MKVMFCKVSETCSRRAVSIGMDKVASADSHKIERVEQFLGTDLFW